MGEDVCLIDSALEITSSLKTYLLDNYSEEFKTTKKKRSVLLTDKSDYFELVINKIFKKLDFKVKLVDIK